MLNQKKLIAYRQRQYGYCLTGRTNEQVFFLHHGPSGDNGKYVESSTIQNIFGDYHRTVDPTSLMIKKHDGGINNDIARLAGCRIALASETEQGKRLATALVKRLVGQDKISARFLNHEFFEFQPQFKLILVTNHLPGVPETNHAFWRRVRRIHFDFKVPEEKKDKDLADKLKEEYSGVLNWMIQGCLDWQKIGLHTPKEVLTATQNS
jgi:putative DNA primase/helicase